MSSIPDDDSRDDDVGASVLGDVSDDDEPQIDEEPSDDEEPEDISFQELRRKLRKEKGTVRRLLVRLGALEAGMNERDQRVSELQQEKQSHQDEIARLNLRLSGIRVPPMVSRTVLPLHLWMISSIRANLLSYSTGETF